MHRDGERAGNALASYRLMQDVVMRFVQYYTISYSTKQRKREREKDDQKLSFAYGEPQLKRLSPFSLYFLVNSACYFGS